MSDKDNITGFVDSNINANDLQHGELVKVLLLEEVMPPMYLKELQEENAAAKKKAEEEMAEYKEKSPSWKDGGIAWRFAVVQRNRLSGRPEELTFTRDLNDQIELIPGVNIFGMEFQRPPHRLEGRMQKKGGSVKPMADGKPKAKDYFPKTFPARDWNEGVTANNIPAGQEEKFKRLIAEEEQRKKAWAELIDRYNNTDPETCKEQLEIVMGRTLFLCHFNEKTGEYEYFKPQKGMRFQAMVDRGKDGERKYFNLKLYDWSQSADNKFRLTYYTDFNVEQPTEKTIALADALLSKHKDIVEARKKDTPNYIEQVSDEENDAGF